MIIKYYEETDSDLCTIVSNLRASRAVYVTRKRENLVV